VLCAKDFVRDVPWGMGAMSINLPVLADDAEPTDAAPRSGRSAWFETVLSVLFTVTAVLLVSFVAVVTHL
jgi:hypothetical protein